MTHPTLWRRLLAEFCGTALLVTAVVGSGVMATQFESANPTRTQKEALPR